MPICNIDGVSLGKIVRMKMIFSDRLLGVFSPSASEFRGRISAVVLVAATAVALWFIEVAPLDMCYPRSGSGSGSDFGLGVKDKVVNSVSTVTFPNVSASRSSLQRSGEILS